MQTDNVEKIRFVGALKGEKIHVDTSNKVIHIFEKVSFDVFPTSQDIFPESIKRLWKDITFIKNNRNTISGHSNTTGEPILEQVNSRTFRLLNGWTIHPASRKNVLHAGWTEETNEFELKMTLSVPVAHRKFRKFLTLESVIKELQRKEPEQFDYVATNETGILSRERIDVIDVPKTSTLWPTSPFYHAVVDITEATQVKIVDRTTDALIFIINLGTVLRDGTLIPFLTK